MLDHESPSRAMDFNFIEGTMGSLQSNQRGLNQILHFKILILLLFEELNGGIRVESVG